MINKVTLIGNTGGDPETRRLESGQTVARFSLATNETYKDKEGNQHTNTEWHNIIAWGNLAEIVEKNVRKGMLVFVEGKIKYRKYTDKDGIERNVTDIEAATIRRLEKVEKQESGESKNFPSEPSKTVTQTPQQSRKEPYTDDLPF